MNLRLTRPLIFLVGVIWLLVCMTQFELKPLYRQSFFYETIRMRNGFEDKGRIGGNHEHFLTQFKEN